MRTHTIGIDLDKTTFHLVGLSERSRAVMKKKFSRQQLFVFTANLPASLMGMETCVGSHFLGRALREQGHEVRLIPAQFVRPFVKSNKNDCATQKPSRKLPDASTCALCPSRRMISYKRKTVTRSKGFRIMANGDIYGSSPCCRGDSRGVGVRMGWSRPILAAVNSTQ